MLMPVDVIRSAKIINLKQITTAPVLTWAKKRCDSQCKNNKSKANHNEVDYVQSLLADVIRSAKIINLKQITTIPDRTRTNPLM